MPIFDFECKQCGHRFEALVLKSAPVCPECKSEELEKLLSLPAVKSETTRGLAMKAAKKRDKAQGTEREWTQRQYELHHDD